MIIGNWIFGSVLKNCASKSNEFPTAEIYGLSSQMKRCSISIPSNIADGSSRKRIKEYSRFISIALGSAFELETQLDIAFELNFIDEN